MRNYAHYLKRADFRDTNASNPEEQKRLAIAKCHKRIESVRVLCVTGDMEPEDYLRIKEENEREIAHWESFTTGLEQAALEFALCANHRQNGEALGDFFQ